MFLVARLLAPSIAKLPTFTWASNVDPTAKSEQVPSSEYAVMIEPTEQWQRGPIFILCPIMVFAIIKEHKPNSADGPT